MENPGLPLSPPGGIHEIENQLSELWSNSTCAQNVFSCELFCEICLQIIWVHIKFKFVENGCAEPILTVFRVHDTNIISGCKLRISKTLLIGMLDIQSDFLLE